VGGGLVERGSERRKDAGVREGECGRREEASVGGGDSTVPVPTPTWYI
jgi:hypothetical protein